MAPRRPPPCPRPFLRPKMSTTGYGSALKRSSKSGRPAGKRFSASWRANDRAKRRFENRVPAHSDAVALPIAPIGEFLRLGVDLPSQHVMIGGIREAFSPARVALSEQASGRVLHDRVVVLRKDVSLVRPRPPVR